ncbi:sensor histidine kinase [Paenibacillus sepulcri]|uniref:Sensor histidine kinase n=1 Tax=Paenibacillus sepulcri TaxID=359917 RepID=A0ABS7BYJ5_9BACL|nr:sensor histidine kinase [Paenibacillus sepulcri]
MLKTVRSVRTQILILLLAFIIAPTTIISIFTISKSTDMIEQNAMDLMETALGHSKENMSNFMNDAADATLTIMTNDAIIGPILKMDKPRSVQQSIAVANLLEKYLYELKVHGVIAKEIAVINLSNEIIYSGASTFRPDADLNWYGQVDRLNGKPYWGSYENNGKYIYVARKVQTYIKSADRFEPLGAVLISFDENDFSSINSSVKLAHNSEILIANGDGQMISSSDPTLVGSSLPAEMFPLARQGNRIDLSPVFAQNEASRLTVYDTIPNSDWSIIVSSPVDDVLHTQRSISRIILLSTGLCVIVAFILAAFLAHRMTLPLKQLSKEVKRQIKSGDFSFWPLPASRRQDEIADLGQGFYRLVADLNETKNMMHQAEMMKREAEFEAMKSKIKPHFLYNSLESIRMLAVINKDPVTADMIKSLGHLFRYIITNQKNNITLADELEYLHSYINLQRLRYEDRLKVEIDISGEWMNARIQKLVLQPLVENSIEHGINRKRGAELIRITASRSEHGVLLQVWDDGAGIDPDTLASIRASLEDPQSNKDHIGLLNVHRRLRLHFGEPYGLTIDSEPGVYTSVFVLIPERE